MTNQELLRKLRDLAHRWENQSSQAEGDFGNGVDAGTQSAADELLELVDALEAVWAVQDAS